MWDAFDRKHSKSGREEEKCGMRLTSCIQKVDAKQKRVGRVRQEAFRKWTRRGKEWDASDRKLSKRGREEEKSGMRPTGSFQKVDAKKKNVGCV